MTGAADGPPWSAQCLDRPFDGTIPELLETVAGLNAQSPFGAVVGIWARSGPYATAQLDELLQSYQLVKINVMRGTVHLLTARQYLAWRPALRAVLKRNVAAFCKGLWTTVDYEELLAWGTDFVSDGRPRTRGEMADAAAKRFRVNEPAHLGFAMRMILPLVEVAPTTVWRPVRTRYVYAPTVLDQAPASVEDGQRDLARSFARAFGSSSVDDFCYWSGMTKTASAALADALADGAAAGGRPSTSVTTVLPEFDNIYFCRRTSTAALYRAKKDRRLDPARMPGTLIADGAVVADWKASAETGLRLSPWTEPGPAASRMWNEFAAWYREHRPIH